MPIYVYVVENNLVPLMPIFLPGIDETTTSGYVQLMIIQLIQITVCVMGFLAFEFLLEIIIISSMIFGKLIALETELINNDLENGMILNATYRLKNILLMHQEMSE